jgi:hypothetical protein
MFFEGADLPRLLCVALLLLSQSLVPYLEQTLQTIELVVESFAQKLSELDHESLPDFYSF